MEGAYKRQRIQVTSEPNELNPTQQKRMKSISPLEVTGKTIYYLANEHTSKLPLPTLRWPALFNRNLEIESLTGNKAISALVITPGIDTEMYTDLLRLSAQRLICITNQGNNPVSASIWSLPSQEINCNFWLVRFEDRLRIVVTSARAHSLDVKRHIHTVWFQDFERGYCPCKFAFDLSRFVYSLISNFDLETNLDINLGEYDFGKAAVELITTVPGTYPPHHPFGLLRLASVVPKDTPYSALLIKTTELMSDSSLLLAVQAQLNLPSYTNVLIGYPSYHTVASSTLRLGGGGCCRGYISPNSDILTYYHDIILKRGFTSSGKSAIPGYNFLIVGGDLLAEDQMVIYNGSHGFSQTHWGRELETGEWSYESYDFGIAFRANSLRMEEAREILRHIPYVLSKEYNSEDVPWQPRRHLLYL